MEITKPAAASAAQKELVKVLAQCQADKGYKDSTGALIPYEFKKLTSIPAGVVSEGNRVFVHAVIDSGIRARTLLGFYLTTVWKTTPFVFFGDTGRRETTIIYLRIKRLRQWSLVETIYGWNAHFMMSLILRIYKNNFFKNIFQTVTSP